MKIVGLDTSHRTLSIVLMENDKIVESYHAEAFKTQSETILVELARAFERAGWTPSDANAFVITIGPGSYTGVRIAMTVAKVICSQGNLPLFTLSSLQLMAGVTGKKTAVMDARSNRVYIGCYENGSPLMEDKVLPISEALLLIDDTYTVVGDGDLIGRSNAPIDLSQNFLALKDFWKPVANVHELTPVYLKVSEAYLKS